MSNNADISKISSQYILKNIFSFIEYKTALKIIKYNKNIQKRLGITVNNYEREENFLKYKYIKEYKNVNIHFFHRDSWFDDFAVLMLVFFVFFFIYYLVYSIILVKSNSFDDNNTKDIYQKALLKNIRIINACLFILDPQMIEYYLFFLIYVHDASYLYGKEKRIISILEIINNIIPFVFDVLVIYKIIISYKIKDNIDIMWSIVMDYIFLFLNIVYTVALIIFSYWFFTNLGKYIKIIYTLINWNNIKIKPFNLPDNFNLLELKIQKKIVSNNFYNYVYDISEKQIELINNINDFRVENNLKKLISENFIPDFFLKRTTFFNLIDDNTHFLTISDGNYLIRYPVGEFEEKFLEKDENIIKIKKKIYIIFLLLLKGKLNIYFYPLRML